MVKAVVGTKLCSYLYDLSDVYIMLCYVDLCYVRLCR